jgi:hypothetical protein
MGEVMRRRAGGQRGGGGDEGEAGVGTGLAGGRSGGEVPSAAWFQVDEVALSIMFDVYCRMGFPMPDLHNRDVFDMEGV